MNTIEYTFTDFHMFSGSGGLALGVQNAETEYRGIRASFISLGGVDCDPLACTNFEMFTGNPAFCMDLFSREDYVAFHGHEPPVDWQEVVPEDLLKVTRGICPDALFLSPPCKGFSGLLPKKSSESEKYQALNRLTVRGIRLALEAFRDDLPGIIMIENVPRITTRGAGLLKQIKQLLASHGYVFHEAFHDCGELGGLGQHRKRYLLIARRPDKVQNFVYQPPKLKVKSIGEILGSLPMPDDPKGGPMHRMRRLQWKTWVRLALIPAGGDWRDLEKISPEEYKLEHIPRNAALGVLDWEKPSCAIIGNARVGGSQASAIADPRLTERDNRHPGVYQVVRWQETGPCVTGTRFGSGSPAIADPRTGFKDSTHSGIYRIGQWDEPSRTVTGAMNPSNGAISISDPRRNSDLGKNFKGSPGLMGVLDWKEPSQSVTGSASVTSSNCPTAVADPRLGCICRNGSYGVQAWDEPAKTVTSADVHAGSAAVADPRIPADNEGGVWVIIALDGSWHRPLTTWELMALQGFPLYMPDGSPVVLAGNSDAKNREQIGNAVPPATGRAIAEEILRTLLLSKLDVWELSNQEIWVMPAKEDQAYVQHN